MEDTIIIDYSGIDTPTQSVYITVKVADFHTWGEIFSNILPRRAGRGN